MSYLLAYNNLQRGAKMARVTRWGGNSHEGGGGGSIAVNSQINFMQGPDLNRQYINYAYLCSTGVCIIHIVQALFTLESSTPQ